MALALSAPAGDSDTAGESSYVMEEYLVKLLPVMPQKADYMPREPVTPKEVDRTIPDL